MFNRLPTLTILSCFIGVAAVYDQLTDTVNSGLNGGLTSGVGGKNTASGVSPLFRPYGSGSLDAPNIGGEFDGGVAQSAPYLSINNYGASAYNADSSASGVMGYGVGGGGSGGCCMPAATANALAAVGSGTIGYYDSGYNTLPYSTMYSQNAPVYSAYGSGALPSSTGYYGYPQLAQLPYATNTITPPYSNSNYYGGAPLYGSGGYQYRGSQPHSLCFPLCAGKSSYEYGNYGVFPSSPMYGSFDSNGLPNGYGGTSFNRQPYYPRINGNNYEPSSLFDSDGLMRRAKGFVRVGAAQRHEAAKKVSTKKVARH